MATAVRLPEGYLVSRRDSTHPDVYAVTARESEIDVGLLTHESDGWHAVLHLTGESSEQAHSDPADALADLAGMLAFAIQWCYCCGNEVDEEGQRSALALDLEPFCATCRQEMAS